MERREAQRLLDCYWGPRARRSQEAHYLVATRFSQWNQGFSVSMVALAAVTGSGLFATISKQNPTLQKVLAVLSLITALVAAVQRSLQYAKRSVEHQLAGIDWEPIVTATEELREELETRAPTDEELDDLRVKMDGVTKRSPQIPQRIFKNRKIGETYLYGDRRCPGEP